MRFSVVCLVAIAASMAALAQEARDYTRDPSSAPLHEWRLDAAWFGADSSSEFRYVGALNKWNQTVMWVKPGFELRGQRVRFAAWECHTWGRPPWRGAVPGNLGAFHCSAWPPEPRRQ